MSTTDIVFIGTAIMDSIIKGFDPEPVSAAGYRAESGSLNAGGEAVNGSIAAAKLGMRAAILCSLGNDGAGRIIETGLKESGVDTGRIAWSDERPTPVTTIFVGEDGNRKSITNTAHRYNFHPERYKESITDTKAAVLGSLFRAGDNFLAGFASEIIRGSSVRDALVFANACGAICSTAVGAGAALKDREQVLTLITKSRD